MTKTIPLAAMDHVQPPAYLRDLFFFELGNNSPQDIFARLSRALEQLVELVPLLKGQFVPVEPTASQPQKGRYEISVPDKIDVGTLFVLVDRSNEERYDYAKLKAADFPFAVLEEATFTNITMFKHSINPSPTFRAQMTILPGGGFTFCPAFHHWCMDGESTDIVLEQWAALTSGTKPVRTIPPNVSDRSRWPPLLGGGEKVTLDDVRDLTHIGLMGDEEAAAKGGLADLIASNPVGLPVKIPGMPDVETVILRFPREKLRKLVARAVGNSGKRLSTNDAICALLWRTTFLARGVDPAAMSKSSVALNGRSRTRPPIDEVYVGNVSFVVSGPAIKAADIVEPPFDEVLHNLAASIRSAVNASADGGANKLAASYLSVPDISKLAMTIDGSLGNDFVCSSWYQFNMLKLNWGEHITPGGRPVALRLPTSCFVLPYVFLPPRPAFDGMEIICTQPPDHMKKLLAGELKEWLA